MTGYRYAPFDLKRFCYVYTNAFNTLKALPDGEELFYYENTFFWDTLCQEQIDLVDEKCFRFIHVEGAHAPCLYDEDMNVTKESNSYETAVKACLTMTKRYMEMIKESGVYDNTCIVIMSDHGDGSGFNDNPMEIMEEYVQKGHAGNWDTLIKINEF